jgi:hypothetical protein
VSGERGRRALGLGNVCVAGVACGLASVAIVLGKDVEPESGRIGSRVMRR